MPSISTPPKADQAGSWRPVSEGWQPLHLLWILFLGAVFVSGQTLAPNQTADSGLDPSWNIALHHAAAEGWVFGQDIVYTYGPLGRLVSEWPSPHGIWSQLGFLALLHSIGFAFLALLFSRQPFWLVAPLLLLHLAVPPRIDVILPVYLLAGALVTLDPRRNSSAFPWLLSVFVALVSLVKFTFFLMGFVAIAAVALDQVIKRKYRNALILVLGSPLLLMILWVLAGQPVAALPPWLIGSFQIASGYGAAMHLSPEREFLIFGVGLWIVFFFTNAMVLWDRRKSLLTESVLPALLIGSLIAFLLWKHGFTRADWHVVIWLHSLPLLVMVILGRFSRTTLSRAMLLIVAIGMVIIYSHSTRQLSHLPEISAWRPMSGPAQVKRNLKALVRSAIHSVQGHPSPLTDRTKPPRRSLDMVGQQSITILGNNLAPWIRDGFNLSPLPLMQSFSAYSDRLNRMNAAHFTGASAPDYVAIEIDRIDHQFPLLADSLSFTAVMTGYQPVHYEDAWLLMRRSDLNSRPTKRQWEQGSSVSSAHKFGEWVEIPPADLAQPQRGHRLVWATIEVEPTLLESVRSFLYQPSHVSMEVDVKAPGHLLGPFRVPLAMAEAGFLLSPLIIDTSMLARLIATESPLPNVTRIRLDSSSRSHDQYVLRLQEITWQSETAEFNVASLWKQTLGVEALGPAIYPESVIRIGGPLGAEAPRGPVIRVKAPSGGGRVLVDCAVNWFQIENSNFAPDSWSASLVAGPLHAPVTKWTVTLAPAVNPEHRGWTTITLDFPAGVEEICLVANQAVGLGGNIYWRNLRFERP